MEKAWERQRNKINSPKNSWKLGTVSKNKYEKRREQENTPETPSSAQVRGTS
jgi:hypothetical protein